MVVSPYRGWFSRLETSPTNQKKPGSAGVAKSNRHIQGNYREDFNGLDTDGKEKRAPAGKLALSLWAWN